MATTLTILSFEDWYDIYEEEISINLAESGADRELDFDSEREFEKRYTKYIDSIMNEDLYVLVRWPDSQDYMEYDWFKEEAILALGKEEFTGSSAYFIPVNRIKNENLSIQG